LIKVNSVVNVCSDSLVMVMLGLNGVEMCARGQDCACVIKNLGSKPYLKAYPTVYTNHASIIIIRVIQIIYFLNWIVSIPLCVCKQCINGTVFTQQYNSSCRFLLHLFGVSQGTFSECTLTNTTVL